MKSFDCLLLAAALLAAPVAPVSAAARPIIADLIIRGGMLFDGSDRPAFTGDVAIKGDRVRVAFDFPRTVEVHRREVADQILANGNQQPDADSRNVIGTIRPANEGG
jgi:hypothetical protein